MHFLSIRLLGDVKHGQSFSISNKDKWARNSEKLLLVELPDSFIRFSRLNPLDPLKNVRDKGFAIVRTLTPSLLRQVISGSKLKLCLLLFLVLIY
jgi:hypothetical protein